LSLVRLELFLRQLWLGKHTPARRFTSHANLFEKNKILVALKIVKYEVGRAIICLYLPRVHFLFLIITFGGFFGLQ